LNFDEIKPRDRLYITRDRAVALGFTHEGSLYGAPSWMIPEGDDAGVGVPKFVPLLAWVFLCEAAADLFTWFMTEDQVLKLPIHVRGRIDGAIQA
jgi:hypothetical protein